MTEPELCPCGYSTSNPEKMTKHKQKIHGGDPLPSTPEHPVTK